jgi:hypothetical protein
MLVTMRALRRPFTSLPAMLVLFGALLFVQLSAESTDGAHEVCVRVCVFDQRTNECAVILRCARYVLFSRTLICLLCVFLVQRNSSPLISSHRTNLGTTDDD